LPSLVVVHVKDGALLLIKNQQKSGIILTVGSTDFLLSKLTAVSDFAFFNAKGGERFF